MRWWAGLDAPIGAVLSQGDAPTGMGRFEPRPILSLTPNWKCPWLSLSLLWVNPRGGCHTWALIVAWPQVSMAGHTGLGGT